MILDLISHDIPDLIIFNLSHWIRYHLISCGDLLKIVYNLYSPCQWECTVHYMQRQGGLWLSSRGCGRRSGYHLSGHTILFRFMTLIPSQGHFQGWFPAALCQILQSWFLSITATRAQQRENIKVRILMYNAALIASKRHNVCQTQSW